MSSNTGNSLPALWCGLWLALPAAAGAGGVENLQTFLAEGNRTEAVVVRAFTLEQDGRPVPVYANLGREERRRDLGRRPRLEPRDPRGPFSRRLAVTARIDRTRPLTLRLGLAFATQASVRPLARIDLRRLPDTTPERLETPQGRLRLRVADPAQVRALSFEHDAPGGRHTLVIHLFDRRRPFTYVP